MKKKLQIYTVKPVLGSHLQEIARGPLKQFAQNGSQMQKITLFYAKIDHLI